MQLNFLGWAIPLFIGFIYLEYVISKKKKLNYFNLQNTIANISIGIGERLADVFVAGAYYFVYDYLQKNFGLFQINAGIPVWIVLFLFTDFIWYWYHRLAHEMNVLWMVHVVHHQSEDFNYSVSARITVLQSVARTCFWCVLPLIGFPAEMIVTMLLVHGLYPFFIHTRTIGKLGIVEYILVTPSHHRVHHASNEKYLDKNYGDVLIVWDKLFGTFQKEEEEPNYGLTKPLDSYSFLWQHFHFAVELWLAVRKTRGWLNKLKLLFAPPDSIDPNLREEAADIFGVYRNKEVLQQPLHRYVIWQMILLLIALMVFILFERHISLPFHIGFTLITILTLINCGAIMEKKHWTFHVEYLRLLTAVVLFCYAPLAVSVKTGMILLLFIFGGLFYRRLQNRYHEYVLGEVKR